MAKKITILTGAGYTCTRDFSGISTESLTNEIRNLEVYGITLGGLKPGEYIYRKLCQHYNNNSRSIKADIAVVNFETIIHFLEEFYAFQVSKHKIAVVGGRKRKIKGYMFKGVKPSFLKLKDEVENDFKKATDKQYVKEAYLLIANIFKAFINHITHSLVSYSLDSNNQGMTNFNENFLKKYLPDSNWTKRIYTLNYDDWISRHLNYFDGFDSSGNIQSDDILNNFDINCHYNLHGCVFWETTIDKERVTKSNKAIDLLGRGQSSDTGIDREPLIPTPIISGYNKMQRMKFNPYIQLYYSFQRDIIESEIVLLIGYGFGDTHINNLLKLCKGKVVLCNYLEGMFEGKKYYLNPWTDHTDVFINIITNSFWETFPHGTGLQKKEWFESNSDSGRIRVWWQGIGDKFYKNWKKIIA